MEGHTVPSYINLNKVYLINFVNSAQHNNMIMIFNYISYQNSTMYNFYELIILRYRLTTKMGITSCL